ncbi:MAG: TetR/AcrR family transcriptional regulator [Brachybacterium sp.]|uniref:TetR family transcriptional regulator n=1 Tax=Brachybacterium alimentarium TaxID=47845 RepID=UPI000BB773A6|nr:TetR family transcriptional regulator [Brachybacterium alimentarium]PCC32950.1 TetR family transcriptional regulator [Brachybacterium alimentarium]
MSERSGGRPRQIDEADVVRAGRELGMRELSLNAVATRLNVSSTALYRLVDGRWGLERLVGEDLLDDLRLPDDPQHGLAEHLVSFGVRLGAFLLERPGLGAYVQTLFPRGEGGRRILADEISVLVGRGYSPESAMVVCSAVAGVAVAHAAAQDARRARGEELAVQESAALAGVESDRRLGDARQALPEIDDARYTRLLLAAVVNGILAAAPPGRPVDEIIDALESTAGRS